MSQQRAASRRRIRSAAFAIALATAAAPCWSLDLRQAWQAALVHDPQWRAARAAAQAGRERLPQARALLRPQAGASFQRSRNDLRSEQPGAAGEVSSSRDRYTSAVDALTLRQPIYRPQALAELRQAQAQVLASDALFQAEEQELLVRVAQAYFEVLLAREQQRLVGVQQAAYLGQLASARKGFAGGAGTRTDVDEAQARLDLNRADELQARQAVELAQRRLAILVGQEPGELAPLPGAGFAPPDIGSASVDAWVARAEQASPELRAARAQVEASRQEVRKAEAGHQPTLDAVAQLSHSDSDNPTRVDTRYLLRSVGLQLTIPLYEGGATQSRVRQAIAQAERAESLASGAQQELAARVYREFRAVAEGGARIAALEQAVRSSEQVVISNRHSQAAGVRTVVDILNAEQQLGTARRDLARARVNHVLAVVRLHALAGDPPEATVHQVNTWLAH